MILIAQLNVSNIYMSFEYYLLKSSMPLTELKEIKSSNIYHSSLVWAGTYGSMEEEDSLGKSVS